MSAGASQRADDLVQCIDLTNAAVIVDVGGGQGRLIADVLSRVAHLRGVVADRPEVLADPDPALLASDLVDRVELIASDFFADVPTGGDVYVLSRVLHDWPDAEAGSILRTCRAAMHPGARLCILEAIVPPWDHCADSDAVGHAIRDLNMFVLVGGQERTALQYELLLNASGFTVTGIISGTACDVIEAVIQTAV